MTQNTKVLEEADAARISARRDRFEARSFLWEMSVSDARIRGCGRRIRSADGVTVKASGSGAERRAGFSGLVTCGSVWACPCCASKILAHRQTEIEAVLLRWHEKRGRVGLVTLTMRHNRGQSLAELWEALSKAWARVTSGRSWVAEQKEHGVMSKRTVKTGKRAGQVVEECRIHFVRVVEVTHGKNGWHVHLHVLLLLAPRTSRVDVELLGAQMFSRWRSALDRLGVGVPSWEHGVDARRIDGDSASAVFSEYFTKANYGASMEVTRSDLKDGRGGNRTPWQVLRGALAGDADDLDVWNEYEVSSRGRRQLTLSHGLREFLLADVEELTDDEIAEKDEGGEVVEVIEKDLWWWIVRHRLMLDVLAAAEADDLGIALLGWLTCARSEAREEIEVYRAQGTGHRMVTA